MIISFLTAQDLPLRPRERDKPLVAVGIMRPFTHRVIRAHIDDQVFLVVVLQLMRFSQRIEEGISLF
jgi:hypothetical protein